MVLIAFTGICNDCQQVLNTSACQYNEDQYRDTVSYRGSSVVVIHDTQNVLYRRSLKYTLFVKHMCLYGR